MKKALTNKVNTIMQVISLYERLLCGQAYNVIPTAGSSIRQLFNIGNE